MASGRLIITRTHTHTEREREREREKQPYPLAICLQLMMQYLLNVLQLGVKPAPLCRVMCVFRVVWKITGTVSQRYG